MNQHIAHIHDRIARRDLDVTVPELADVAKMYAEDTAVILGKRISAEGIKYGYDVIILIVRNSRPVTIMTRRQSQNFDKRNFNVQKVSYLS